MLLYLPFMVFLLSFILVYKRNGFDLAACILLLYVATSLASILLEEASIQYSTSQLSTIPVLLHCGFTLALTFPFILLNTNKKRYFKPIRNRLLFNSVCNVFILLFVVELLISLPVLFSRMTASNEELAALRAMAYAGELDTAEDLGSFSHLLDTVMNILSTGAMCMIIFFFYSICFMNKKRSYNTLLLISSMTSIIYSIITVDRSKLFFWFLLFLLSYFLFKPYIPKVQKKYLFLISIPVLVLFLLYFITVTVARFGETEMTAEGSILNYAGQPLFNICFLWDSLPGTSVNFRGIFPLTYYILDTIFGVKLSFGSNVYTIFDISDLNGFNALVGYGVREVGHILTIVLLVVLVIIMYGSITHVSRMNSLSLQSAMTVFLMGTIVICGFISYYYTSWPHALMFWFFVFVSKQIS